MNPLRSIDKFLNGITMYRLVLYALRILVGIGITFSVMGVLSFSPVAMVINLCVLVGTCYAANKLFSILWSAPTNIESWNITALILFCILPFPTTIQGYALVAAAGLIAMASKYLLAWRRKHLANPAAIAAAVLGLTALLPATWWIGSEVMLPFTLVAGLLIVRKIRRARVFFVFTAVSLVVMLFIGLSHQRSVGEIILTAFTSWPLVFLGTIMLTEPSTMPPRPRQQLVYGGIVGAIFASQQHIGPIFATPEVALIIGNLYSYAVSPRYKMQLRLKEKIQLSERVFHFVFTPDHKPSFLPGQYMEWTLPHNRADGRGNRRTFTIASSPTEAEVHLGVKFYEPSSTFKQTLKSLEPGAVLTAGSVAGSYTLPRDTSKKLVFLAGGIGITPFRSIIKYLVDTGEKRDITLVYLAATDAEISYRELFTEAIAVGVKLVPVVNNVQLTAETLPQSVDDHLARYYFISGPKVMVDSYRKLLHDLHVPARHITTDYFSGY